jgi:PadR family transcriptional regulator PadR
MGRGNHLGELEELILLAVLRLGDEADGAAIRDELKEHAGRTVSVSTVYVTLMRLEEKGYARSWKGEPTAERGGKARRCYEVSPEGVEALHTVREVRARMWSGLGATTSRADHA